MTQSPAKYARNTESTIPSSRSTERHVACLHGVETLRCSHTIALYDCCTTDIAVDAIALPSMQMLDDVVVRSEGAAATVGCLCSM